MIILIGSRKGGVGKSTVATNLAVQLALEGANCTLVDADPQGTATNWALDRASFGWLPKIQHDEVHDADSVVLRRLDGDCDYVVVDAAGRDSAVLRAAMAAADLMIVPLRPSQADLDVFVTMRDVITRAQELNPNLDVRAVITMASSNPNVRSVAESIEYLKAYSAIQPLATVIRDRKIYQDALADGRGVGELANVKARQEIHQMTKEILNG